MADRVFEIVSPVRSYQNVPLTVKIKDLEKLEGKDWYFEDLETGQALALQSETGWWTKNAWMRMILPEIKKGQAKRYKLTQGEQAPVRARVQDNGEGELDLTIDGETLTTYQYSDKYNRPFLHPLVGPEGKRLTRSWPMDENAENEDHDHEHHKSVWSAHGDLNGHDLWTEWKQHGRVFHTGFEDKVSGPVFCRFSARHDWKTNDNQPILRSYIEVMTPAVPSEQRALDYIICFRSLDGDVKFGDTKEGGLFSVRMTQSMNGRKGGLIANAYGGLTESECWGKPSPWVDYSGPVDGKTYGIAMFDNPENPHFPTRWHVRDYGLFAANPFALHDYLGDDSRDGSAVLKEGEVWKFQYRLYLHKGDSVEGKVSDAYHAYVNPPTVKEVEQEAE